MTATPSAFAFLAEEWPDVFDAAERARRHVPTDPRAACFYSRRALELSVKWAYQHDRTWRMPYDDKLSSLVHAPSFKDGAGQAVFNKARLLIRLGNKAVHDDRPVAADDAKTAVRELAHVCAWLARTYGRRSRPPERVLLEFGDVQIVQARPETAERLRNMEADLAARDAALAAAKAANDDLDRQLQELLAQVAAAKAANEATPDTHDYSEAETRTAFIDLLLDEAGWTLGTNRTHEEPLVGMPTDTGTNDGEGFADYVLWGADGRPLAVVEAKRTTVDAKAGRQQAKLYADCLEARYGQRPVIFFTNGYEHWLWNDTIAPPRRVSGFHTPDELQLAVHRRATRQPIANATIDTRIVERPYQHKAILRVCATYEAQQRKALLVMATGTGKTRVAVALADVLIKANWAKRVLFLADRRELVKQAVRAFKAHLPDTPPVNLLDDRDTDGRVYVSTHQTMMGLIDETADGRRRFGPGHFDLIVIDEAHRSVFQRYRAIFDYFDAHLLGLTATPAEQVDRNTYELFDLEPGVPTDAYTLDQAVTEGYLVPPFGVSVPLNFVRSGIRYDQLSTEEQEHWDALEWDPVELPDGTIGIPDAVDATAINQWLFNTDTVDKMLEHLMTHGERVAGGDRLGKTIIFARNQAHADFIEERFDANYPHLKGHFARTITHRTKYADSLIEAFGIPGKDPHIAISVDMLDTGIDVPDVVNLVFFKPVHSKIKFWQMIGRGTRLRPDLFGPGHDKAHFYVFDYCGNLEFFSQELPETAGSLGRSLGQRLFVSRVRLVAALDGRSADADGAALRANLADLLRVQVASAPVDNFLVRPHLRLIERYREADAWGPLTEESIGELTGHLAALPMVVEPEPEQTKRFDLLMLGTQLALLDGSREFATLRRRVIGVAKLLEDNAAVPAIKAELALIGEAQTEGWWDGVTVTLLEHLRLRLRGLVPLIEKRAQAQLFTNVEEQLGEETFIEMTGAGGGAGDFEQFRKKVRAFLRDHDDLVAVRKLRSNRQLTSTDLAELERVLRESGVGDEAHVAEASAQPDGLGVFVRALVGLDPLAAREALSVFLTGRSLTADQHEFVEMVVDELAENGVVPASRLYESPFTGVAPTGPEAIFDADGVDALVAALDSVRGRAKAG